MESSAEGSDSESSCEVAGCSNIPKERWYTPCCHVSLCEEHRGQLMVITCTHEECPNRMEACSECAGLEVYFEKCRGCQEFWDDHLESHSCSSKILGADLVFHEVKGLIRVGRIVYEKGKPIHPSYPGFTPIVVMTKSSAYGDLGPYVLKDEEGRIMENLWQFRKVYPWVPKVKEVFSPRYDRTVVWEHQQETHITNGKPNEKYWAWRQKGLNHSLPVRYPVGNTSHRKLCLYVLTDDGKELGLVEGRKQVYLHTYAALVKRQQRFHKLKKRLEAGENLLIIEVDGPHQESLEYYQTTYNVGKDFIENSTMLVTLKNIGIMLKDSAHSFGHGYCLAMALLDWV